MSGVEVISLIVIVAALAWTAFIVIFPGPRRGEDAAAAAPPAEGPAR